MAGKKDIVEQALKLVMGGVEKEAPKVVGTDAAGRPMLDFRGAVVSHFTDPESAADIWSHGYRQVGDGYYGRAVSFTPNREYGRQFGGVETNAIVSPNAKILDSGNPEHSEIIQRVLNDRSLSPTNPRPGQKTWDQKFRELGYDGLYDPGAGDLFIYNPAKVKPLPPEKSSGGSIREGYGPGGWVDDVVKMAGKVMGTGEEAVPVSRIGMNYKDVTKRVPELTEAAKRLQAGEIGQSEYSAMVDRFKPVEPYASVPDPASVDDMVRALTANKREKIGKLADYPEGHPVALRLDIPAYTGHGVWVPTIHDQKTFKSISHEPAAHIAGAQFSIPENKALAVAAGGAKGPFATIDGSLLKTPPEAIHERAKAAMNDPDWVQVGMDPERHSYFYDRKTMQPVISAEEVIQVGPLVLARKPVYGNAEGFKYSKGGRIAKGPGGWLDDVVKMAGKVISGEGEDAAKAGIRAYHSSPHDFDKFEWSPRTSMTGEGAQAYGAGLYFAENPSVSGRGGDYWRQFFNKMPSGPERSATGSMFVNKFDRDLAAAQTERNLKYNEDQAIPGRYANGPDIEEGYRLLADQERQALDMLRSGQIVGPRTYEVNINADPDSFLDWDKPLSEQPALGKILTEKLGFKPSGWPYNGYLSGRQSMLRPDAGGDEIYRALGKERAAGTNPFPSKEAATEILREAGIPGIKYLDAGSRGAGEGTRNYVVFDDKIISIIRKYGIAGASAMLGYNLMEQLDPKQALAASMADQDYQSSRPQRSMGGNNSISGALNVARGMNGGK